jgi:hypothetical protein
MRWLTILLVFLLGVVTAATAAASLRAPTAGERAPIQQASFDYYFSNPAISRTEITKIRVLPLAFPLALGKRRVTKYAVLGVKGWDASGQFVGPETAVAVYYTAPSAGWRLYNDGTEDVGCAAKWYPAGQEKTILAGLGLRCV